MTRQVNDDAKPINFVILVFPSVLRNSSINENFVLSNSILFLFMFFFLYVSLYNNNLHIKSEENLIKSDNYNNSCHQKQKEKRKRNMFTRISFYLSLYNKLKFYIDT